MSKATTTQGLYIYCVAQGRLPRLLETPGIAGEHTSVWAVQEGDLCALVSESPLTTYRVERQSVLHHQRVVEEAMAMAAVLPVKFATIATREQGIRRVLRRRRGEMHAAFDRVRDKHELGLKVTWRKDVVFEEILREDQEIAEERDALSSDSLSGRRDHWRLMVFGEKVQAALKRKSEREKEAILSHLRGLADEVRLNDPLMDRMILNAAFLVPKSLDEELDQAVNDLAAKREQRMLFKYVGPLPPANFVEIVIDEAELESEGDLSQEECCDAAPR
ncbi:MAG: GvpL/GvpF family gas vesicle protein [Planctomycetes bacterium]|nr:GvpL/GvpF family gas vesicle protein [Planctomycetota bacterium]